MRCIVPLVRLFPIWRYGTHYELGSSSARTVIGWYRDRYEYRYFKSEAEARAFKESAACSA